MGLCGNMSAADTNATIAWVERFYFISSIVIPTVCSVVLIGGLIGNATLIYTILANKSMRTKSNVLIVSMAAGDFLLILFSLPVAVLRSTIYRWVYGEIMCKVIDLFVIMLSTLLLEPGVICMPKVPRGFSLDLNRGPSGTS